MILLSHSGWSAVSTGAHLGYCTTTIRRVLHQAVEVLDSRLDDAAKKQLPYPEMLADLPGVEVDARRERYLTTRTRMAKLPFHRTLDEFDFGFQPSIDKRQVKRSSPHSPSCRRQPTCCCWDSRESSRLTWRWHLR